MEKNNKPEYVFIWGNTQGIATLEGDMNALVKYRDNPWNRIERLISVSKENKISCHISKKDIEGNIELGKKYFDPDFSNQFLAKVEKRCEEHRQVFRKLEQTDFATLPDKDLYNIFSELLNQFSNTIGYFRGTQMEGTQYIVEEITKNVTPAEAAILLLSAELDPLNYEQIDWQKIASKPHDEKSMLEHVKKYPWLVSYHFTVDAVAQTLRERYNYDKNNLKPQDIAGDKAKLKEKQVIILKKYPELDSFVELLNKLARTRIELKSCWAGNDFYLIPVFGELSKRFNEKVSDLANYYLEKDIKNLIEGTPLSAAEKTNRRRCTVSFLKDGKAALVSGEKAEKLEKEELIGLANLENIKELKGVVANPGKARGKVKIVGANDVEKTRAVRQSFVPGEILVTEMTQPNIVDIAKKAGAIVTDEGGMLSHAAIISREFGIPCIVGTHTATKVLKDGDMVEVDAEKGIVKILKQ